MSRLGGVIGPASTPADPRLLDRLAAALTPAASGDAPDATFQLGRRITLGPAAMVVVARWPGEADLYQADGLLLGCSARLDNRTELDAVLGTRSGDSDCVRLERAYRRWGTRLGEQLIGDYGIAIWDGARRMLLLVRDAIGVRPLFYWRAVDGSCLVWGSTMSAVLAASCADDALDEQWIGGYLTGAIDVERTPFRQIRAVAPGQALVVVDGRVRAETFWSLAPRPPLVLSDDRAYEQRFAELFEQAVACRLAEPEPVMAELSGGLDSSSIVCVADRLIRDRRVSATSLLTVSAVYRRSPSSDERRYITAVERHIGRTGRHLSEDDGPAFAELDRPEFEYPSAFECIKVRERGAPRLMAQHGIRVLLSGVGGDNLVHSEFEPALPLADLVRPGRLGSYLRALPAWQRSSGEPYPSLVGASLALAIAPRRYDRRTTGRWLARSSSLLSPDFVRRTDLEDRVREMSLSGRSPSVAKRRQVAAVWNAIRTVSWLYDSGSWPHHTSYPFLHRPLVEFCLAVPAEQFLRPGQTRSLHRRALRSWLPAQIVERRDKRGPDEAIQRDLVDSWWRIAPMLERPELARHGFVDPRLLARMLQQARYGRANVPLLFLVKLIALEAWLRARR